MMPAMSVSAKSTRRLMRNGSDMNDPQQVNCDGLRCLADRASPSRHVMSIKRGRLCGHAVGMEACMDRFLALASQLSAMGGIVEQLPHGVGQIVRISRLNEQSAAGCFKQLRKRP